MSNCPHCGAPDASSYMGGLHVCVFDTPMDPNDVHDATVLYRTDEGVFCRIEPHAVLVPGDKLYIRKRRA